MSVGADREVWRVPVSARVAGAPFQDVKLDVVSQFAGVEGGLERLTVPAPLPGAGLEDAEVLAVDVAQHAAEKLHAMARTYTGERPSSRVKDLVDLVLLIEARLLDPGRVSPCLEAVYAERDSTPPPPELPRPPDSWNEDFPRLVGAAAGVRQL